MDADIAAAREARYIAALEAEPWELHSGIRGAMEVTALMQQLEELDQAAQRSVAAEIESAVESRLGEAAVLVDDAGRERILEICKKVRKSCARIGERTFKLQRELQKTAMGEQDWQRLAQEPSASSCPKPSVDGSDTIAHLQVPRSSKPLSYWDSRIWSMGNNALGNRTAPKLGNRKF